MNLSEEQLKVVQATESQIAVVGPPGTGKTRVLTERIKYLIKNGVKPEDIVAITFTNFAANEMKARLSNIKGMFIGTMHSYAVQLLYKSGTSYDIKSLIDKEKFDEIIKIALISDLKLQPIKYLFVDEVQDLCDFEFDFIKHLVFENIFLGGDADQCIYQFKGSNPKLFINFCNNKNTKTYLLTHNYRCGQRIIDWAEYFVEGIPGRIDVKVTGDTDNKGWVTRKSFDDAIYDLYVSENKGNWFILTRTNAELNTVAIKLKELGISYITFKQGDLSNEEIENFLKSNDVKLLTIHSAKGLETDNVIVVGARNYNLEEMCIEYVAATRARYNLYWCPGFARTGFNAKRPTYKKKVAQTKSWE